MRPWQAVVFDLDDTLYPESQFVASGMTAVAYWAAQQFAFPEKRTLEQLAELMRRGVDGHTFDHWLAMHGLPQDLAAGMVDVYRGHEPAISPYPGVVRLLESLRRECRLGMVTDGHWAVQQRKVVALGLDPYFHTIVYTDERGREFWKPSPESFQYVLDRLGVSAAAAIYVGDNPKKDFRGARETGMATVRIRHAGGLHHNLEPATEEDTPVWDVTTIEELNRVLREPAGHAEVR